MEKDIFNLDIKIDNFDELKLRIYRVKEKAAELEEALQQLNEFEVKFSI